MLTDPEFVKRLETLFLLTRRVLGGTLKADRKSDRKGSGIVFADHSEYKFGDDYRNINWHVYGRLEQLVVKMYELEEDVSIHILLDLSRSMKTKCEYACKLAAALGYIALSSIDRLDIYGISDELAPVVRPCHGRAKIFPMLRSLSDAECYGDDTRFSQCIRAFQSSRRRRGVCVLISDFFAPGGYQEGLNFLKWAKHDVFCIQVLDPAEIACNWKGDLELECIETHRRRRLTVGPAEVRRYAEAMANWNGRLRRECARREIGLVSTTIDVPFENIIQDILRRGGLVG